MIDPKKKKTIFVFGSNLSGIHGAGAAKYAHQNLGAVWGVGEGLTGKCYALPTKGFNITFMNSFDVEIHISNFLKFANNNPSLDFKITQIGCGLAGMKPKTICTMFQMYKIPDNCYFDTAWKDYFPQGTKFWGTY